MNRRERKELFNKIKYSIPQKKSGLSFRKKRKRFNPRVLLRIFIWVVQIAVVVSLAYFINKSYCMQLTNSGESMESTIAEGATVWVDTLSYQFSEPKVGDVIAFLPSGNILANYSIKRVVAVPGDTVLISEGVLYVNGEAVELENSSLIINDPGRAETEITLGEDEYFVLGDNVNYSEDSRYSSVANVKLEHIYGRVWFVPQLDGFGFIN